MTITKLKPTISKRLVATPAQIREFCQRWKVNEMSLFGSILRNDFRSDSDIDVLVIFANDAEWNLFDYVHMQNELEAVVKRKVDIVEKYGLTNPYKRDAILSTCQSLYKAE